MSTLLEPHARSISSAPSRSALTPTMAELKMEKKGDAEVAKITADIDALKAEAAQVRVLPARAPHPSL